MIYEKRKVGTVHPAAITYATKNYENRLNDEMLHTYFFFSLFALTKSITMDIK